VEKRGLNKYFFEGGKNVNLSRRGLQEFGRGTVKKGVWLRFGMGCANLTGWGGGLSDPMGKRKNRGEELGGGQTLVEWGLSIIEEDGLEGIKK